MVSTLNTTIPSSPWSLLQASNCFFVSNVPLKVSITLIRDPTNCFNYKLFFLNFILPIFSLKFLDIKMMSLPVNLLVKNMPINFILHIFRHYQVEGLCLLLFLFFFLWLHTTWKWFFSSLNKFFSRQGIYFSHIPCHKICIRLRNWLCCRYLDNLFVGWTL